MSDQIATFGIKVPVETNAEESANSIEGLRKQIAESQAVVKAYGSSLKSLRGDSDAVTEAKIKLRGAQNAERDAISRAVLALGAQGTTLSEVARKTKELIKPVEELKVKTDAAKGPAADLAHRFTDLKERFTGTGAAANIAVLGMTALLGAVVAVGVGVAGAAVSLGKFILEAGNELRTMGLFREAATGSAENAKAFGHQIDALGNKIPTPRKELNELSLSLSKALVGTRVSGQGIVDTFNAVAQTSAAMGDSAGSAIEGIITRGKMMGRMSLGVNELQGTGIGFQDVAKQLASDLHIGIAEAQNELFMGRVKIDAGASAIRKVVENKFGGINLKRMLDINVIAAKFKDKLSHLTEDINLGPMLEGFSKLAGLFDTSTVTGSVLKGLMTDFGNAMTKVFVAGLPFVETFFTQILIESLKLEIALISLGQWADKTFGTDFLNGFSSTDTAISIAKTGFEILTVTVAAFAAGFALIVAPILAVGWALQTMTEAGNDFGKWLKSLDWSAIGTDIVDGLVQGLTGGIPKLFSVVANMGQGIKEKFRNVLQMHSPSKAFFDMGEDIPAGAQGGIEAGTPGVQKAVGNMVAVPPMSGGGASRGGSGVSGVEVHFHFPNVHDGAGLQKEISSASFKASLTRVLEEVIMGAGTQTQGAT